MWGMRSVYFLSNAELTRVKIGKAARVAHRTRALQACSPEPLLVVGELAGYTSVEKWLHERFRAERLHHEWFFVSPELAMTVRETQRNGREFSRLLCPEAYERDHAFLGTRDRVGLTAEVVAEARRRFDAGDSITSILQQFPHIPPLELGRATFGITWRQIAPTARKAPSDLKRLLRAPCMVTPSRKC